jgi:hypothetical protein
MGLLQMGFRPIHLVLKRKRGGDVATDKSNNSEGKAGDHGGGGLEPLIFQK